MDNFALGGKHAGQDGQTFGVTFKLFYETVPGENLYVVGTIPEIQGEGDHAHPLVWTTGHVWVSRHPLITKTTNFQYRYIIKEDGDRGRTGGGEAGLQRYADLTKITPKTVGGEKVKGYQKVREVEIHDQFQRFDVKFTVFHPVIDQEQEMFLSGSTPELGVWKKDQRVKMAKVKKAENWIYKKYGETLKPYQATVTFYNSQKLRPGQPFVIDYGYFFKHGLEGLVEEERVPPRILTIHNPAQGQSYNVNLGSVILNGGLSQEDANFEKNFFLNEIEDTGIFVGPYPSTDLHIKSMVKKGINAVMNLQTAEDLKYCEINWQQWVQKYKQNGINTALNFPVDDMNEQEYPIKLFAAAQYLNDMVNNKKLTVLVHDSTGISRCSSVLLTYLCLFKRSPTWQDVPQTEDYLKQCHELATPNKTIVNKVILDNQEFQAKQQDPRATKMAAGKPHQTVTVPDSELAEWDKKWRADEDNLKKKFEKDKKKVEDDVKTKLNSTKKGIDDEFRRKATDLEKDYDSVSKKAKVIDSEKRKLDDQHSHNRKKMMDQVKQAKSQHEVERDQAEDDRRRAEHELEQVLDARDQHDTDAAQEHRDLKNEIERVKLSTKDLEREAARAKKQMILEAEKEIDDIRRKAAQAEMRKKELLEASVDHEGISEDEIDYQCDQLFRTAPIRFKPRKGHPLDEKIAQIIAERDITIPVVHIKDNLYLIGSNRCTCELKQENVIVRLGGGNERFDSYVPYNHRLFERNLVIQMNNSDQSLEWVVDQLIQGKKIKTGSLSPLNGGRKSLSPVRQSSPTAGSPRKSSTYNSPVSPYK